MCHSGCWCRKCLKGVEELVEEDVMKRTVYMGFLVGVSIFRFFFESLIQCFSKFKYWEKTF